MKKNNDQSNTLIKWIVLLGDFAVLNVILLGWANFSRIMNCWPIRGFEIFLLMENIALILAQMRFSPIIHLRLVGAGALFQRIVGLATLHLAIIYMLLKIFNYDMSIIGWVPVYVDASFFVLLLIKRMSERWFIKLYRQAGRNTRAVTLVGNDPELITVYEKLILDTTMGYRVLGYYADTEIGKWTRTRADGQEVGDLEGLKDEEDSAVSAIPFDIKHLGSLQELLRMMREEPEKLVLGDEVYVSLSRRDKDVIKRISRFCDHKLIRFFYVPVSVESIGLNLKREFLDDMEIYTTYENPLQNPVNKALKRTFDIVLSMAFLGFTALLFPIIYLIIKIQSPGPIFFRTSTAISSVRCT